jgi:DNA-binding NtrC family response regulator
MPVAVQTKILRALEERTIQPVGSTRSIPVDVRVVSATHQDLPQAIADGHFRQDLYYRIRGVELAVPPLRSRRQDVVLLAEYFLDRYASRTDDEAPRLAPEAVERLLAWDWPGNVRELDHVVTAAAALCAGGTIRAADIELPRVHAPAEPTEFEAYRGMPLTEGKARLVETFERARIREALQEHDGNVTAAARSLGIHRQSLQQKLHQLGMDRGGECSRSTGGDES